MSTIWFLFFYIAVFLTIMCLDLIIVGENDVIRFRIGNIRGSKLNTQRFWLAMLLLVSFCALCTTRSIDSYDTSVYMDWLNSLGGFSFFQRDPERAYGKLFELLGRFVLAIGGNYRLLLFICPLINAFVVYRALVGYLEEQRLMGAGVALYFSMIGFPYGFIILRQGLALTMVIAAYSIMRKSKKIALILCLVATLFHESAIIAFFAILLLYRKGSKGHFFTKTKLQIILGISFLFYISHVASFAVYPVLNALLGILNRINSYVFHKYILYFEQNSTYQISLLYVLYFVFSFMIVSTIRSDDNTDDYFFVVGNVIGLCILSIFASANAISRLVVYILEGAYIFLLPKTLSRLFNNNSVKLIVWGISTILLLLQVRIITGSTSLF